MMQLRYAITLFLRKMTSHRWDSVPKRCFLHAHPLETPSDAFQNLTSSQPSIAFQISDRPEMSTCVCSFDPEGSQGFGMLDELIAVPGGYRVTGDFGTVQVQAKELRMEIGK